MAQLDISGFSTPHLIGALVILFIGYKITQSLSINARIRKLGARAPVRKHYLPYGIDIAYDAVNSALENKSYDMWLSMFKKYAPPGHYTLEAGIGARVIFTADPENIKAILATQFKDYGKGEEFRKDWYPFLGNGMWYCVDHVLLSTTSQKLTDFIY